MAKGKWEKAGVIGVDAGLCWIGDPCYVFGDDASHQIVSWEEFCEKLKSKEKDGVAQWQYDLGHDGLGVSVSTGYGDGAYPVYVRRNSEGRIAEAKVVFIEGRS